MIRSDSRAALLALLELATPWAFVSYLHPSFSGEVAEPLLRYSCAAPLSGGETAGTGRSRRPA